MGSRMNSRLQSRRGSYGGEGLRDESKSGMGGTIKPDFLVQEDEEDQVEGTPRAEEEEVDEGEMRKIVMGRVGGWVDWAVGWMDFRGEDDEGDAGEAPLKDDDEGDLLQKKAEKQHKEQESDEIGAEMGEGMLVGVPPPPPPLAGDGVWTDTKWLLGVASKIVL